MPVLSSPCIAFHMHRFVSVHRCQSGNRSMSLGSWMGRMQWPLLSHGIASMEALVLWRIGRKYDELRTWRLQELQAACEAEGGGPVDAHEPCERGNASSVAFADVQTVQRSVARCALVSAALDVATSAETLHGTCKSRVWTCSGLQAHACSRKRAESVRSKCSTMGSEGAMELTENAVEMQVDEMGTDALRRFCRYVVACGEGR